MTQLSKKVKKVQTGLNLRLFQTRKELRRRLNPADQDSQKILMIMGCQRSGTSILLKSLEKDVDIKIYGEKYPDTFVDVPGNYRLKPLNEIDVVFGQNRFPYIVIKPLVESQNGLKLLDRYPNAKIIWMYRHFKDVTASNLKNFGNDTGLKDLKPIVDGDFNNWRAEGVSETTRSLVSEYYNSEMTELDAAALFWIVRNQFFFDLQLAENKRVLLCRYRDFVSQPKLVFNQIYQFAEFGEPDQRVVGTIHARSIGKGKEIPLSEPIRNLCQQMMDRLDSVYHDANVAQTTCLDRYAVAEV